MGSRRTLSFPYAVLAVASVGLSLAGIATVATWDRADDVSVTSIGERSAAVTTTTSAPPTKTRTAPQTSTTTTSAPPATTSTTHPAVTTTPPAPRAAPTTSNTTPLRPSTDACGLIWVEDSYWDLGAYFPQCPTYGFDEPWPDPKFCGRIWTVHHYGYIDLSGYLPSCPYDGPIPVEGYRHNPCWDGTKYTDTDFGDHRQKYDPYDPCTATCPEWFGYIFHNTWIDECYRDPPEPQTWTVRVLRQDTAGNDVPVVGACVRIDRDPHNPNAFGNPGEAITGQDGWVHMTLLFGQGTATVRSCTSGITFSPIERSLVFSAQSGPQPPPGTNLDFSKIVIYVDR